MAFAFSQGNNILEAPTQAQTSRSQGPSGRGNGQCLRYMESLLIRITTNPRQCGGRPCIRGMHIRVADVLQLSASGLTAEQILAEMPDLEALDLQTALHYAACI